jgi:hypothetical protein
MDGLPTSQASGIVLDAVMMGTGLQVCELLPIVYRTRVAFALKAGL